MKVKIKYLDEDELIHKITQEAQNQLNKHLYDLNFGWLDCPMNDELEGVINLFKDEG